MYQMKSFEVNSIGSVNISFFPFHFFVIFSLPLGSSSKEVLHSLNTTHCEDVNHREKSALKKKEKVIQ